MYHIFLNPMSWLIIVVSTETSKHSFVRTYFIWYSSGNDEYIMGVKHMLGPSCSLPSDFAVELHRLRHSIASVGNTHRSLDDNTSTLKRRKQKPVTAISDRDAYKPL